MIHLKLKGAYDSLNLPRDASLQDALDRFSDLKERLTKDGNFARLQVITEAVEIIRSGEAEAAAQRDSQKLKFQSKSERDLELKLKGLIDVKISNAMSIKRHVADPQAGVETKKSKKDEDLHNEAKSEEEQAEVSDSHIDKDIVVFDKLNRLLREEGKYLRAVNVLTNMLSAILERTDFGGHMVELVTHAVDVVVSVKGESSRIPLCNLHEDNRRAADKLLKTIESSTGLVGVIEANSAGQLGIWNHAIRIRNAFYELDNFLFAKRCKELLECIRELSVASMTEHWERMLHEVLATVAVLSSNNVARNIPGRLTEVKSTMTEIYKLTRNSRFPPFFRDSTAELQRGFSQSL